MNECLWCSTDYEFNNSNSDSPDEFCSMDCQEDYEEEEGE